MNLLLKQLKIKLFLTTLTLLLHSILSEHDEIKNVNYNSTKKLHSFNSNKNELASFLVCYDSVSFLETNYVNERILVYSTRI